jgi:hypothetical protein
MWQMTTFRAYKNPKGKTLDSANATRVGCIALLQAFFLLTK